MIAAGACPGFTRKITGDFEAESLEFPSKLSETLQVKRSNRKMN